MSYLKHVAAVPCEIFLSHNFLSHLLFLTNMSMHTCKKGTTVNQLSTYDISYSLTLTMPSFEHYKQNNNSNNIYITSSKKCI